MNPVVYRKKQLVFRKDEEPHLVHLICSGLVKVFQYSPHNRAQILNLAGPGDILGLSALFQFRRETYAVALTRSQICSCRSSLFQDLLETNPLVTIKVMELLYRSLARAHRFLLCMGTEKALSRVASSILYFRDNYSEEDQDKTFQIPLMRKEMSSLLGLSPETISRQMKKLIQDGTIEVANKRITIVDMDKLEHLV
jgi:CRP-like cAMP-binding protein